MSRSVVGAGDDESRDRRLNHTPAGANEGAAGVGLNRVSAAGGRQVELAGFVVDLEGNLIELGPVSTSVVSAEQKIAAAGEHHAYVCLGSAAIAAVGRSKNWSRCGNGTCHAYLQQSVARNPSGPLLARISTHHACSNRIEPCHDARETLSGGTLPF